MIKSLHSVRYKAFLTLLGEARIRSGLTQRQVASKLKITQSAVSKVESGERRLDVVELHAWCEALGESFTGLTKTLDSRLGRD